MGVIADPTASHNTLRLRFTAPTEDPSMRFANRPAPDNPKTSTIATASLVAKINRRLSANDTWSDQ
ncbi:MAG: DUF108 domain-containing protein [Mesorhizobium sp.]|nr:MAG: DUF108 domain-containing protein [Mesorhizobium sp.]TIO54347.1 MAG: DUF108 domain-containing protein [Mesorhizobium sp.]TIO59435.1 MAG: DUF108 domain-containing protein [Mesorhizobium sp.]TJV63910.1 MAG: DUF108 domain-containing protein [Mesorhizobium sp.]